MVGLWARPCPAFVLHPSSAGCPGWEGGTLVPGGRSAPLASVLRSRGAGYRGPWEAPPGKACGQAHPLPNVTPCDTSSLVTWGSLYMWVTFSA